MYCACKEHATGIALCGAHYHHAKRMAETMMSERTTKLEGIITVIAKERDTALMALGRLALKS